MINFDCHAHVFEKTAAIPGARYIPKRPAPLVDWLENQRQHNLRGGVIVQVSFLGTDNSELCAALAKLDRRHFAGVAVVDPDVDDAELDALVAQGVRGVRWNLVRGAVIPDTASPIVQAFFAKLRRRNLHLEVHLEGARLASHLPALADQGVNLVIDHFGLPTDSDPKVDPLINAVKERLDRKNLYFKFSAHYRTAFDLTPHANALLDLLVDDHIVWGSDWPHTQHESATNYSETCGAVVPIRDLSDTEAAKALYGIATS